MKSITYTAARRNLASTINRVCEDNAPVVITRNRDQAVVMLSLDEYESLQETAHLLRSPANAKRLYASLESIKRGAIRGKALGSRSHSGTRFKVAGRAESQASTAWCIRS